MQYVVISNTCSFNKHCVRYRGHGNALSVKLPKSKPHVVPRMPQRWGLHVSRATVSVLQLDGILYWPDFTICVFHLVWVLMWIALPPRLSALLAVTPQNDMEIKSRATPGTRKNSESCGSHIQKMCFESTFWINLFVCICFFSRENYQCRSPMMDDHLLACLRLATSCYCYDYEKQATSSQYQQSHLVRELANFNLA